MMKIRKIYAALLVFAMTIAMAGNVTTKSEAAMAENEVHCLAFASDRHGNTEAIGEAMKGMPDSLEYISVIGDIVGGKSEKKPAFNTSDVFNEIQALGYGNVQTKDDMSILWADHDTNNTDDAEIVFANGGDGSGVMRTGCNEDGSIAYYLYGIAFNDMKKAEKGEAAAKEFEEWINTVTDKSIPIIVCCHVPLHYARGDNKGANAWSLALNYAATGKETTEADAVVNRDVVFLYGHNHTTESKTGKYSGEYFIPRESEMEVGATEGSWTRIFYTYTTAGYLNQNNAATLVSVDSDSITLSKYQSGNVVDGLYDSESKKSGIFANKFVVGGTNVINRVDPSITQDTPSEKATNPILISSGSATVKYSAVKKKKQTIAVSNVITVRNNKGKITYKKSSGNKKLTVATKTGKITVKKGLKKGTYKLKIKVKAAGNANYKSKSKTVTVSIKVS